MAIILPKLLLSSVVDSCVVASKDEVGEERGAVWSEDGVRVVEGRGALLRRVLLATAILPEEVDEGGGVLPPGVSVSRIGVEEPVTMLLST